MKNLLSLLTVAGIAAVFAAPAHAEEFVARYTYLVNGTPAIGGAGYLGNGALGAGYLGTGLGAGYGAGYVGAGCGNVLTQPAIVGDACGSGVLTQPAVLGRGPIMVEDHENFIPHFFHLGLWPLVDFSIF